MEKTYECSICKRKNVKLWRPYMDTKPLICAVCAEERQSLEMYDERAWKKVSGIYKGKLTGTKLPLPKWKINEEGNIPSYKGPGPYGEPIEMIDNIRVNIEEFPNIASLKSICMVPAIADGEGCFYADNFVPEQLKK